MSFTGQIGELPLGTFGLSGSKNLASMKAGQLIQALNVQFHDGAIGKEGGATKYNSSPISGAASILGGWDWWPASGTQRAVVYTDGGAIKKDSGDGTFPVTLVSGLSGSCVPVFVEGGAEAIAGNRKLFSFNGANAVQVLAADAATMSNLATPPADWSGSNQPITGCIHENRLWGALAHRVYYSLPTNHEDFTAAGTGSVAVFPGEGERIVQIMSFKSLLIIWKYPTGIYTIDTSSVTTTNWRVARLNRGIGGAGPLAALQVNDDVLFLDATGNFQLLSGIMEFGQIGAKDLSHLHELKPFFDENVALGQLGSVRSAFYVAKKEAHFAVAQLGSTTNTARFVVDFNRPDIPRFRYSTRDTCQSLWLRKDTNNIPRLMSGDALATVWYMDQSARSKDSAAYTGSFQTAYQDFGAPTQRKLGKFLEIVAEPKGNWDLSAKILWDGKITQTVAFSMNPRGVALGTFILGTDVLGDSTLLSSRKRRIVGSGKEFSVIFYNAGAAEDFNLSKSFLYFTLGDERVASTS
jgi:hypothetical protein